MIYVFEITCGFAATLPSVGVEAESESEAHDKAYEYALEWIGPNATFDRTITEEEAEEEGIDII